VPGSTRAEIRSLGSILPRAVDTSSQEYRENSEQMQELLDRMNGLHTKIARGGNCWDVLAFVDTVPCER
jgi:hypothetical protein